MPMRHFVVEYRLEYEHIVRVGVRALSCSAATESAREALDKGTIWDDSPGMPLLYDVYEELPGNTVNFTATEVESFPTPDPSVKVLARNTSFFDTLNRVKELQAMAITGNHNNQLIEKLQSLVTDLEELT